ncbi:hypothetical protein RHSIM_Rhsim06G0191200 [Rhododendron simsii]|uniref:Non-specific serine/threonine protein kinase n=1 Tax=Rhododendron simsii TaxID=118357 RepID=A0A834LJ10_RHOSS|nr:hypothetical protein RHSIM_Rhsim06G0191200 [Rhododendron simsii]
MRTSSNEGFTILLFLSSLFSVSLVSEAADTITTVQFITENETIVSADGGFELGFFSPGSSNNRYLGIWYKKLTTRTVVWLANRETPITDASGVLKVVNPGILVLFNGSGNIVWSSNTSRSVHNPVAQLLESGNFVLRNANDDNPENFLWQSFDYPVHTLLPGMKLGKNLLVGLDRHLSSWKSDDDPAQGDYTFGMNTHGYPQLITDNVTTVTYRTGPWNGLSFSGTRNLKHNNTIYEFNFVFNREEVYYGYELLNQSVVSRLVLHHNGILNRWTWVDRTQGWIIYCSTPTDNCDYYGSCGAYGSCDIANSPMCGCLDKFVPRYPKDWVMGDWSNGCMRRTPLACHKGEGFLKYSRVKLPDTQKSWFNETMTLEECGKMCSENCSCMAYANLDIRGGGTGCLLWFGDLIDIIEFSTGGQDIYVRMAASELGIHGTNKWLVLSTADEARLDFAMVYKYWICVIGYMSPEYAADGLFSVKSDVFSFGVLILEIVSGTRNKGFFHPDHYRNLLGHAWTLHKEDRSIELIDPTSKDSCCPPEVLRSIHVGLLCVQQHPDDRPSMSSMVLMLGSEGSISLGNVEETGICIPVLLKEREREMSRDCAMLEELLPLESIGHMGEDYTGTLDRSRFCSTYGSPAQEGSVNNITDIAASGRGLPILGFCHSMDEIMLGRSCFCNSRLLRSFSYKSNC